MTGPRSPCRAGCARECHQAITNAAPEALARLAYEHALGEILVGDQLITFDGVLRVWLGDDVIVETPFWDKVVIDPTSGKITTMYALFSIAAVPEKYWKDLKPEDFA